VDRLVLHLIWARVVPYDVRVFGLFLAADFIHIIKLAAGTSTVGELIDRPTSQSTSSARPLSTSRPRMKIMAEQRELQGQASLVVVVAESSQVYQSTTRELVRGNDVALNR
jgi:hypothetical protein